MSVQAKFLNGCDAAKSVLGVSTYLYIVPCLNLLSFGVICSLLVQVLAQIEACVAWCDLFGICYLMLKDGDVTALCRWQPASTEAVRLMVWGLLCRVAGQACAACCANQP